MNKYINELVVTGGYKGELKNYDKRVFENKYKEV